MSSKLIVRIGISLFVLVLIVLYKVYDPIGCIYFPKCPFWVVTGYKCPGCGSQRAIHDLLNLDILQAMKENVLLVFSVPYLLLGALLEWIPEPSNRLLYLRKLLYGQRAIYVLLTLIILFWIIRNSI